MAQRSRKFKEQVWRENPHCYWCGVLTVLHKHKDGESADDNTATLDHVFTNLDPRRRFYKEYGIPSPVILVCLQCNKKRGGRLFEEYLVLTNLER